MIHPEKQGALKKFNPPNWQGYSKAPWSTDHKFVLGLAKIRTFDYHKFVLGLAKIHTSDLMVSIIFT